jgi:hypothetical protein
VAIEFIAERLTSMAELRKLTFNLPPGLRAAYENTLNANLFDGDNLVIYSSPEDYKILSENTRTEPSEGIRITVVEVIKQRYSFEVKTKDDRKAIAEILTQLISLASANPFIYQPITLKDYICPNPQDLVVGYTERSGVMDFKILGGGYHSFRDNVTFPNGYSIVFSEV